MNDDLMQALSACKIIDISQPISRKSACFPGDVPFSSQVTMSFELSHLVNLTAFTMSPHVGTHADAPNHIAGPLEIYNPAENDSKGPGQSIGWLPLRPFLGPATVIDLAPFDGAITVEVLNSALVDEDNLQDRVLFRTQKNQEHHTFKDAYAYLTTEVVERLAHLGAKLVGIDTPSVDHVDSEALVVHHQLVVKNLSWLENLDLSQAPAGDYLLIAFPLKFMELEASPVRAVLLV